MPYLQEINKSGRVSSKQKAEARIKGLLTFRPMAIDGMYIACIFVPSTNNNAP